MDTSALILALGNDPQDERAEACRDFFKAMTSKTGHDVLIASPSLAEYLRRSRSQDIPRVRGVAVVAFDERAARMLAERLPPHVLSTVRASDEMPAHYIKYDAMIVACALRHRAECIISLDRKQRGLAASANLPAFAPAHFQSPQQQLL